jgi:hypothetical protein
MWDSFDWGTLFDRASKTLLVPGVAYRTVQGWLAGGDLQACAAMGSTYSCRLTPAGGGEAVIMWDTSGSVTARLGTVYRSFQRLDGTTTPIADGVTVTVGIQPILIQR